MGRVSSVLLLALAAVLVAQGENFASYAKFAPRDSYSDGSDNQQYGAPSAHPSPDIAAASIISGHAVQGGHGGGQGGQGGQGGYGVPSTSFNMGSPEGQMYHYQLIPSASQGVPMYGAPGGMEEYDDEEGGGGGGGGGEIACLAALLGLKGVKGVKALKAVKAVKAIKAVKFLSPLLLPVLLLGAPIILIVLALPLLLLLFLPVPVITLPSTGRTKFSSRMAQSVLTADECVERISCEISRVAKSYKAEKYLDTLIEKTASKEGKLKERISRAVKSTDGSCAKFTCNPIASVRKAFNLT